MPDESLGHVLPDPDWYIKQAVYPISSRAKDVAQTEDPVVFVDRPTTKTGSLIGFLVTSVLGTLVFFGFAIWLVGNVFSFPSPGAIAAGIFVFVVLLVFVMQFGSAAISNIHEALARGKKYISISSHGIEIWQKNDHLDLPWTDVDIASVHIYCSLITLRTKDFPVIEPRIWLSLTPERWESLPKSLRSPILRTAPGKGTPPYNAVIPLNTLREQQLVQAYSALIANLALERFAPQPYPPMVAYAQPGTIRKFSSA